MTDAHGAARPKARAWGLWFAALALSSCGTLASPGEANRDLPNNRTGPFRPLTLDEGGGLACVATDPMGSLEDPSAVRSPDGAVWLYVTRLRPGRTNIARVVLRAGVIATGDVTDVLVASQAWEGNGVASPRVIALPDGTYAMAYSAQGALGIALSADGVTWRTRPVPALTADPSQGEGTTLESPSLVRDVHGSGVLVYASAGAVWLARGISEAGPFTRVDADRTTAVRDPILARDAPPDGGASFESGALGDPDITLEGTSAGRDLWRLYYTAHAPPGLDAGVPSRSIGMAASFDGVAYQRVGAPVLAPRTGNVTAPGVLSRDALVTLMYVGADCTASGSGRGIMATVAPVTAVPGNP